MLGNTHALTGMGGFPKSRMSQKNNYKIKYYFLILSKYNNRACLLMYLTLLITNMWMGPTLKVFQFVHVWNEI
jgi:hypothetical protein